MKMNMKKRKGSSLLLVLLITAGIVTIIFGTQRIALVQFSQTSREEDNIYALYAAKAGIEDGLLRYRYNKNVETNKNFRFNLADGASLGEGRDSTANPVSNETGYSPTKEFYDLNIAYRVSQLGSLSDATKDVRIEKDQSIDITGFDTNSGAGYYLGYLIRFDSISASCTAEFQNYKESGISAPKNIDSTLADPNTKIYNSNTAGNNNPVDLGQSLVRVTMIGCGASFQAQLIDGSGNANGLMLDGLTTTITSTGYYGSSKRTLVATVDRRTGNLTKIYEFTAYSGQGNVSP